MGPEEIQYSEKFGILAEISSFPMGNMHYNNDIHDIHGHFTWFSGFVILSVRYSGFSHSEVLLYLAEFERSNRAFKDKQKRNYEGRRGVHKLPDIPNNTEVWIQLETQVVLLLQSALHGPTLLSLDQDY